MAALRWPRPLRPGDVIAVTAPSSGCTTDAHRARLDLNLAHLRAQGFAVREGRCLRANHRHVSAPAAERAAELMALLQDDSVAALIPPWGGELACDLLDRLDWPALAAAPPKWCLGYSDTSTWLVPLTLRAGWATAHGPNLMDMAPTQTDALTCGTLAALGHDLARGPWVQHSSTRFQTQWTPFEQQVDAPLNLTQPTRWRRLDGVAAPLTLQGRLLGGCLDTLMHLAGTPYGDVPGFIRQGATLLFLENCELKPTALARALYGLRRAGWFHGLAGLLLGRSSAPDEVGFGYLDALHDVLDGLPCPVLLDADIGHQPPQLTLINGAWAEVHFDGLGAARVAQATAHHLL